MKFVKGGHNDTNTGAKVCPEMGSAFNPIKRGH